MHFGQKHEKFIEGKESIEIVKIINLTENI